MHSPFVYVFVAGILIEEIIRAPRRYRNWLNQRTGMIVEHRVGALEQGSRG